MNEKGVNMLRYESYSMLKTRFIEPRRQKVWLDIYRQSPIFSLVTRNTF